MCDLVLSRCFVLSLSLRKFENSLSISGDQDVVQLQILRHFRSQTNVVFLSHASLLLCSLCINTALKFIFCLAHIRIGTLVCCISTTRNFIYCVDSVFQFNFSLQFHENSRNQLVHWFQSRLNVWATFECSCYVSTYGREI